MDEVKKSVTSVMLSCTKNVLLAVAGIYLFYLSVGFIANNWSSVANVWSIIVTNVSSFMTVFVPFKDFLFEHLGKIFTGWLILFVWTLCIIVKLEYHNTDVPTVFPVLFFMLVPVGSIILFMVASASTDDALTVFSIFFGILLSCFFLLLCGVFLNPDPVVPKKQVNSPKQLELFEKK
jgi:hypothetical protein